MITLTPEDSMSICQWCPPDCPGGCSTKRPPGLQRQPQLFPAPTSPSCTRTLVEVLKTIPSEMISIPIGPPHFVFFDLDFCYEILVPKKDINWLPLTRSVCTHLLIPNVNSSFVVGRLESKASLLPFTCSVLF